MANSNQTTIAKFDGYYLSYTDINGNSVKIPAISGDVNYQDPTYQNLANKGILPQGTYEIKQENYQQIGIVDGIAGGVSGAISLIGINVNLGSWPKSWPAWGSERVWLEPVSDTNTYGRTDFSIHGGWQAGSAGCIDLVKNADTFFNFFKSIGQDVALVVDYSSYNTSIKNPLLDDISSNDNPIIEDIYQSQGLDLSDIQNFKLQIKQSLEKQLNTSLSEESFDKIFNQSLPDTNSSYNLSNQLTPFLQQYQLNSDLNSFTEIIPSIVVKDVNGDNFNLSLIPNFSNLAGEVKDSAWNQFTTSFIDAAFSSFDYDINQFNDFLNENQKTLSEFNYSAANVFETNDKSSFLGSFSSSFNSYFEDAFAKKK